MPFSHINAFICETWLRPHTRDMLSPELYYSVSSERLDQTGGGTMILIRKDYAAIVKGLLPEEITHPIWSTEKKPQEGKLELSIAEFHPTRLPRGFSSCLVFCAYIPEWSGPKVVTKVSARQRSSIFQLSHHIEIVLASNTGVDRPIIFVGGDFNGAVIKPLLRSFDLHQVNTLPSINCKCYDIMLTNAPKM